MKREEQKQLRRTQILCKALELFVQKGYAGTTTSEIAKELRLSEGLLFHYFPTKEQLYLELVELGVKGTEVIPQEVEDPYQVIYNVVDEFLAQARNDRLVAKMFVLVDQAQNKYATPTAVYNIAAQVNTVFSTVPLIKSGQEKGIFRAGDPLALSYTLWNALQGVMQGIAQDPHMPIPEAEWLMAILQGK